MDLEQIREEVRQAAEKAVAENLLNMSEIARRVGWSQAMIPKFARTGHGDIVKVMTLRGILRDLGYFRDSSYAVGVEIQSLAEFFFTDAPLAEKSDKLRTFVKWWDGYFGLHKNIVEKQKSGKG